MQFNLKQGSTRILGAKFKSAVPAVFWLLLIFAFDTPPVAIATLLCAALHEIGHLSALAVLKKSNHIYSTASGMRISDFGILSYREEIFVASMGPGINIFAAIPCFLLKNTASGYFALLGTLNILTAAANLLPVKSYDGARILHSMLSLALCADTAHRILNVLSFFVTLILTLLSLYFISRFDTGYFLFFVFFAYFVKNFSL